MNTHNAWIALGLLILLLASGCGKSGSATGEAARTAGDSLEAHHDEHGAEHEDESSSAHSEDHAHDEHAEEEGVELDLTRATSWTGWGLAAAGTWLVFLSSVWAILGGVVLLGLGGLLGTLQRRLVFYRADGLLRMEQRILGIRRSAAIPLFHLRAVVVAARRPGFYVAYVERRAAGGTIHLDEARRPAPLLKLAEAIADVADLRLVYDATTRAVASD